MMNLTRMMAVGALALGLPLAACAPPQSGNLVNANAPQSVQVSRVGTVISYQTVNVQGTNRPAEVGATLAGAVAGAALGNQVGGGRGQDAARIVGGIAGAAVGNRLGGDATVRRSLEWTVQLDSGQVVTVIQENPTFGVGQRVQVVQSAGNLTRLVAL